MRAIIIALTSLGPIIRIGPEELRVKDPDYYDEIYASSARRRYKDPVKVSQFGIDGSAFSSVTPENHRVRRAPLERFFSKQSISNLEPTIYESIDKLVGHLQNAFRSHKVVSLDAGFAGMTSEIIYRYVYGFSPGDLDKEDFNENVRDGINALFRGAHLTYFFPILRTVTDSLPLWLLQRISPGAFAFARQKHDLYLRTVEAIQNNRNPNGDGDTILDTLISPRLPEYLRTPKRITNEGFAMVIGGIETTARSLSVGAYHIFTNELFRSKLRDELRQVMPTPDSRPTWNQLEKLPYLVRRIP